MILKFLHLLPGRSPPLTNNSRDNFHSLFSKHRVVTPCEALSLFITRALTQRHSDKTTSQRQRLIALVEQYQRNLPSGVSFEVVTATMLFHWLLTKRILGSTAVKYMESVSSAAAELNIPFDNRMSRMFRSFVSETLGLFPRNVAPEATLSHLDQVLALPDVDIGTKTALVVECYAGLRPSEPFLSILSGREVVPNLVFVFRCGRRKNDRAALGSWAVAVVEKDTPPLHISFLRLATLYPISSSYPKVLAASKKVGLLPKSWRVGFATRGARRGLLEQQIAKLLGQKTTASTPRYLREVPWALVSNALVGAGR